MQRKPDGRSKPPPLPPTGQPNWANQTIWTGDNLPVMRGMNSASVDLIYLDPPFNSKANYAAPIGSEAAGAAFKDTWTLNDLDIGWLDLIEAKHKKLWRVIQAAMTDSDKSYLIYMAVRLLEMHRILKPAGSIYFHCDPTMSHFIKLILDAVFGKNRFRNELIWHYYNGSSNSKKDFAHKHDVILFYADKSLNFFSDVDAREPYAENSNYVKNWKSYKGGPSNPHGKRMHDVWRIPSINNMAKERTGYPTQKPLVLLRRIIESSSKPDNMIFDPFCGCATACIAAQDLNRQWAGIDISPKAADLVRYRMDKELPLMFQNVVSRTDIPQRTDLGNVPFYRNKNNKKYLYGEQGGHCNGCKGHFQIQNMTIDHIIPQSKDGTDHIGNLQLLCGHCNSVKGDRGMEYLQAKLAA